MIAAKGLTRVDVLGLIAATVLVTLALIPSCRSRPKEEPKPALPDSKPAVPDSMPAMLDAKEKYRRAKCQENLGNLGRALAIYGNSYMVYPWMEGKDWTTTPIGFNRDNEEPASRSITSLMFMLVCEGQDPKLFVCPSDKGADPRGDPNPKMRLDKTKYAWDFSKGPAGSATRYVSYSYQCPVYTQAQGPGYIEQIGRFENGVGQDDELVVLADRPPDSWPGKWTPANSAPDKVKPYNSPNHAGGVTNVVTVNCTVLGQKTPNCGLPAVEVGQYDCIYTVNPGATATDPRGKAWSDDRNPDNHKGIQDTFLPKLVVSN